jgi:carbamate kinase
MSCTIIGAQPDRNRHTEGRVLPSPRPIGVVEDVAFRALVDTHAVVICGGEAARRSPTTAGRSPTSRPLWTRTVAAMLATRFCADRLLILTDLPAVVCDYGTPRQHAIHSAAVDKLTAATFPAGSMGPKIEACLEFTIGTGRSRSIGRLDDAVSVPAGRTGTTIDASVHTPLCAAERAGLR